MCKSVTRGLKYYINTGHHIITCVNTWGFTGSFRLCCSRGFSAVGEDSSSPWRRPQCFLSYTRAIFHHSTPLVRKGAGSETTSLSQLALMTPPCRVPKHPLGTTSKPSEDGCHLLRWCLSRLVQPGFRDQLMRSFLFSLKDTWKEEI